MRRTVPGASMPLSDANPSPAGALGARLALPEGSRVTPHPVLRAASGDDGIFLTPKALAPCVCVCVCVAFWSPRVAALLANVPGRWLLPRGLCTQPGYLCPSLGTFLLMAGLGAVSAVPFHPRAAVQLCCALSIPVVLFYYYYFCRRCI